MSALTLPRLTSPLLRSLSGFSLQAKLLALILALIGMLLLITIATSLQALRGFEEHISRPCDSRTTPNENGTLVLTVGIKVEVSVVPRV